jgi:hypothetical protein
MAGDGRDAGLVVDWKKGPDGSDRAEGAGWSAVVAAGTYRWTVIRGDRVKKGRKWARFEAMEAAEAALSQLLHDPPSDAA